MRVSYLRTPGRGGGRQGTPGREGPPLPQPGIAALCAGEYQSQCVFGGAKCSTVGPSSRFDRLRLAESVSAVRAVCRLRRFAWGRPGTKGRVPEQVRHTTFVTVPPRYGFAVVNTRLLFLHTSAGKNPVRSVPGSRDTAVPAVGAECVRINQPHTARYARISVVTLCFYS